MITRTVEASHRVDFDGDYTVRFGFPGERRADAKPVKMGFWMDGQLLGRIDVETKPSKLVYFNPFSDAEMRVYLPEGDHVFRAAFIDDDFVKTITDDKDAYSDKKNKFIGSITFQGPYASMRGADTALFRIGSDASVAVRSVEALASSPKYNSRT